MTIPEYEAVQNFSSEEERKEALIASLNKVKELWESNAGVANKRTAWTELTKVYPPVSNDLIESAVKKLKETPGSHWIMDDDDFRREAKLLLAQFDPTVIKWYLESLASQNRSIAAS